MVQASEIQNREKLKAWLHARPEATRQRDAVTIAHRASMRALPQALKSLPSASPVWAKIAALRYFRHLIIGQATTQGNVARYRKAAELAGAWGVQKVRREPDVEIEWDNGASLAVLDAIAVEDSGDAVQRALLAASNVVKTFIFSLGLSPRNTRISEMLWSVAGCDALAMEIDEPAELAPLWLDREDNGEVTFLDPRDFSAHRLAFGGIFSRVFTDWDIEKRFLAKDQCFDFWIRWYDAALAGRPLTGDWESHAQLLTDIALIPDADWKLGAEHIARLIADIEERHRLLAETRRLKANLAPVIAEIAPSPIGHNNPPEGLDDGLPVQSVLIVWDVLNEAEKELEKPKPNKSALRRIAQVLLNASIEIAKYCGKLADTALQKAAEEVGSASAQWAIKIGGCSFAAKMLGVDDLVRNLGEALARYAGG